MAEPILIGTRGWDYPEWSGGFYPEKLPDDWRLSYYANHLRAVLVPAEFLELTNEERVRGWVEDTYDEFRFVLEVPATLADLPRLIAPIRPQVAGLLLRVPPAPDPSWLTARLGELAATFPVCVDLPADWRTPDALGALAAHDAGLCWHADTEAAPRPGGRLMVALATTTELRAQRRLLETLAAWRGEERIAALCFDDPEAAKQARVLAELMVV